MPKLNNTHLLERIAQRIVQLEQGEELTAANINALLTKDQQHQLKTAWAEQQALREQHRPPKTKTEKQQLGWKTIREVRLDIYKQALIQAEDALVDGIDERQRRSEVKAAQLFMDAYVAASIEGKNGWIAGNIALTRAGFNKSKSNVSQRDKAVNEMEDALRKKLEE